MTTVKIALTDKGIEVFSVDETTGNETQLMLCSPILHSVIVQVKDNMLVLPTLHKLQFKSREESLKAIHLCRIIGSTANVFYKGMTDERI